MRRPQPSDDPTPAVLTSARGPVECLSWGDGPAVIALHGAMGGCDQSLLLAKTIGAPGFRYLALSRPGYLGTPVSSGRTPEEQADLYAALLDTLGLRRAVVMAVSGGGPSALHFALRHPERCAGLVLASTCATTTERPPLAFFVMMRLARWRWLADRLRRRSAQDPDAGARRSILDPELRARTLADPEVGPLFRALLASTSERLAERIDGTRLDIHASRTGEYPLEQIRVPTLVIHGTGDRLLPFERHGRAFATRIPGAELIAAEGGDHVAIFTHRAEIQPRVARFLAAHV